MLRRLMLGMILWGVSIEAKTAWADFIHEGFAYSAGASLVQQSGGTGFTGAWASGGFNAVRNDFVVDATSLSYPGSLSTGGSVSSVAGTTINGISRAVPSAPFAVGNVTFMSFLIRRNSTAGDFGGFGGIYLDGTENDLFIGKPGASNVWSLENRGGGGLAQSNYTATVGQTTRLVLRIQVQNAAEAFALYVDPSTELEPVSPSVRKVDLNIGQLTDIVLYTSGDYSYDEIRFGDTFASVTAVPEPSALSLALVSMTGLSCVATFRRKSLPRTAKKESTARVD